MVLINETPNLFWGLCLEPGKVYEQTVEQGFHVSMAALDPSTQKGDESVSVWLEHEGKKYILCSLQSSKILQQTLELNFNEGEEITFSLKGKGTVFLTGFLHLDEPFDPQMDGDEVGSSDEDSEASVEGEDEIEDDDEESDKKRKKAMKSVNSKKQKLEVINHQDDDDEDEEEDEEEEEEDSDSDMEEESRPVPVTANKKKADGKLQQEKVKTQVQSLGGGDAKMPVEQLSKKQKKKLKQEHKKETNGQEQKLKSQPSSGTTTVQGDKKEGLMKKVIEGGVMIEDIKVGHGPEAKQGKHVMVYYTGKLQSGKIFDMKNSGQPFKFKLGKKEVIAGWDIGFQGMKVGGKRKLIIPPKMGYGSQSAGSIPPNSTLIFEVELKSVS